MALPVLKCAGYVLAHTPDMVFHNGTTQTTEKIANPDSDYLKDFDKNLRTYDQAVAYAPNQVYVGNMTPEQLKAETFPWFEKQIGGASRFGKYGEIMPQGEFLGLLKLADTFDLVMLEGGFLEICKSELTRHPLFAAEAEKLTKGAAFSEIEEQVNTRHAEGLYDGGKLVGCVKKAHDIDVNLNAHTLLENLVVKASGILAFKNLCAKNGLNPADIQYIIECSEEACGDMNQRGGGNFAKAIGEIAGAVNATGSDTRGFCAAPTHALIQAASLVKAGTFNNVVVVAGGATAKLGMNGKDHVKKGMPILEDVLGAFAFLVSADDGVSPVIRTDIVGQHNVGTGSSPQAVMTALVAAPLDRSGLKITDVDKYSVEMQNPDITKPAGAGDVPEANYKMIAALAVTRKELERAEIPAFIENHGMTGWAPTQGHIPSGVPYLGFAREALTEGDLNKVMIVGKGSLFLGRMTNLFDGVSVLLTRNPGKQETQAEDSECQTQAKRIKIGVTAFGSEHGAENIVKGAEMAARLGGFDVALIGPKVSTKLEVIEAGDEKEAHRKMEQLLDSGYLSGCVTMHYNFPIGVSTVGKVITPGMGADMFLATTTGTSATHRIEAMVKNAVYGVIAAKAMGIAEPTVGILNVDGANVAARALRELSKNGYPIRFSESVREDGGAMMRGNDLLCGNVDVMVTDTLTGNILMKMFSAYTTGGSYEATGFGYGPGIGEGYKRLILILSRASGAPVVSGALQYAAALAKGGVQDVSAAEFAKLKQCKFNEIIEGLKKSDNAPESIPVREVAKEVVTEEILGIDIMELEDAVAALKAAGIYAESGMGCTGPMILVNPSKVEKAVETLKSAGYM